jgi:predicted nuclease with TOPRIM domain
MKADVSYNDFKGTVAADISDALSKYAGDTLKSIGRYFKLDEKRFDIIGLSIYGTEDFSISLLCVDKNKSRDGQEHIVSMMYDIDDSKENLDILFKRLHIVLHERFDEKYPDLRYTEEVRFSDFHEVQEEETEPEDE